MILRRLIAVVGLAAFAVLAIAGGAGARGFDASASKVVRESVAPDYLAYLKAEEAQRAAVERVVQQAKDDWDRAAIAQPDVEIAEDGSFKVAIQTNRQGPTNDGLPDAVMSMFSIGNRPVFDCQFSAGGWSYSAASFTAPGTGCVVSFSQTTPTTMFGPDGLLTFGPNNQLTNSATLSTETKTVAPNNMILSFYGTGSVTASGVASFTLNGTGAGNQVYYAFTPTAGSLTLTVSGSVTSAVLASVTHETAPRSQDQVITGASAYYGPRLDYNPATLAANGLLIEPASTNLALYSRDLTQAGTWTVSALSSTAKDQTGIDGVANSASSFTAGAANATVAQVVTHVSSTDDYAVWLKRITGTGVINLTLDGVTYTPVAITSSWKRFFITQATVVNPAFGIQIVTSGDKIAVDQNQLEVLGFPTSDIITRASQVSRAADVATATLPASAALGGTVQADVMWGSLGALGGSAGSSLASIEPSGGSTTNTAFIGTTTLYKAQAEVRATSTILNVQSAAMASGVLHRANVSYGNSTFAFVDSILSGKAGAASPVSLATIKLGYSSTVGDYLHGWLSRLTIWAPPLSQAKAQQNSASW